MSHSTIDAGIGANPKAEALVLSDLPAPAQKDFNSPAARVQPPAMAYAEDPVLLAKAETLVEALPYLQRYAGKTFVVKYGGHAMGDHELALSSPKTWCC